LSADKTVIKPRGTRLDKMRNNAQNNQIWVEWKVKSF